MKKGLIIVGELQECSIGAKQVTLHVNKTELGWFMGVVFGDKITDVFFYGFDQWG